MSENADRHHSAPPPVDRISALWRRIHEHKVVQWSVAYIAIAYGIQHGVTLTTDAFDWPHSIARFSLLLLALGLPVAITFAWYHGARASRNFSQAELSILAALLVVGSLLLYVFVRVPETPTGAALAVQEAGVTAARSAAANPRLGIAVAVMPFANVSGDKDQEYFSDGMTDEISGALAKIPDLSVVARSSAFQFKGKNQDARAIGQQLHATHLIEGSVRKAGDQLRISAQVVKVADGVAIWSSSYDRQLKDVFAIQEDIARAVATSLHMTLGLKPGEELINQRQIDPALHDQYLRAKNMVRTRQPEATAEAIRLLNEVVTRTPGYAPAWAALAFAYRGALVINPEIASGATEQAKAIVQELQPKVEAAAGQAVKLDPNNAEAYCALASARFDRGDRIAGMEMKQRGLALDPDDPECLQGYGIWLTDLGFTKLALPAREHLLAVEPLVPAYRGVTARILFADGQTDAAIAMLNSMPAGGLGRNICCRRFTRRRGVTGKPPTSSGRLSIRIPLS